MKRKLFSMTFLMTLLVCFTYAGKTIRKEPIDYVNPYMGNISHLLVPTYPTIHLPNSMLRVRPQRDDFTGTRLSGLTVMLPGHRENQVFNLYVTNGKGIYLNDIKEYSYDCEVVKPYYYSVFLENVECDVRFAPSQQSAMYEVENRGNETPSLILTSKNGNLTIKENCISGFQYIENTKARVFIYMETDVIPTLKGVCNDNKIDSTKLFADGKEISVALQFPKESKKIKIRYGVSLISVEQAKKNLNREINNYDFDALVKKGRKIWNETLSKIKVEGNSEDDKTVFYTSLYRTYERMICISEDGKYYSGFDNKIHNDEGRPFYNDDWIWDTYRATHPLRVLIEPEMETNMIRSFIRMAEQQDDFWMPTFPEIWGDKHLMNCNHGVATILDSYKKGLTDFDLKKAYTACKNAITEKTLCPWSGKKAGVLDQFYKENGYFPALPDSETETVPEVDSWEKRQPVAVTLGTVYDEWCLANIAEQIGDSNDYKYYINRSLNYRKIFHPETKFFHPKDKDGNFIENLDYRFGGGLGARSAYDENNGWIYRWSVQHNITDLINLLGGNKAFIGELERMFITPLGKPKYEFYSILPDQTGNVGQYSMGNEPALHIPYLYNYAGEPWRTQKKIRELLNQWFRNDLMGIPGDEDGGGMSAFVVFSQLGFYPVTPGLPMYVIGSPAFKHAEIELPDHKKIEIICHNYAPENKYIESAKLNGVVWNKSWFKHSDLVNGCKLEFIMSKYPNKQWGTGNDAIPPSFTME